MIRSERKQLQATGCLRQLPKETATQSRPLRTIVILRTIIDHLFHKITFSAFIQCILLTRLGLGRNGAATQSPSFSVSLSPKETFCFIFPGEKKYIYIS